MQSLTLSLSKGEGIAALAEPPRRHHIRLKLSKDADMIGLFNAFKPLLSDFLSTIVLIVFLSITGNLVLSVSAAMATAVIQIAVEKWRARPISIMQWASFALVIVLGSMSIVTHSALFAEIKPTVANAAIGFVMLVPNWQGRYLPQIVRDNVSPTALVAWGYAWAVFEFALAAANLFVALELGQKAWLEYSAFVPLTLSILLFLVQYAWLRVTVRRNIQVRMAAQAA
jgi:intracellular septation protein